MRLFDPLCNCLIPRNFFSSPDPPPAPEPVEPVEIPPVEPVVLPEPPPPVEIPEPEPQTNAEKYALTPEIPMRYWEKQSKDLNAQLTQMKDPAWVDTRPAAMRNPSDPRVAQSKANTMAKLEQDIATADLRAGKLRERTEIINPAALHADDIIPPPATTGSTEAQEKADDEKRKQANRQGMTKSIVAGEQTKDYASSATGSGSLLG